MRSFLLLSLACAALALGAQAADWTESFDGDLSGSESAPTPLTFGLGVNVITGTMGADAGDGIPLDRDIFTFTLAPGQFLTSINFLAFSPTGASFYAIAPGTSISLTDPAGHLSNVLISSTGEYLDDLDLGAYSGGTGLASPLGAGTYTIWFQELASVVSYSTAYTVVPEPSTWLAVVGGIAMFFGIRQRRRA